MAAAATSDNNPARPWDDEIDHLLARGPKLPSAARQAVCDVLDSLLAAGELDPRQADAATALRHALTRQPQLEHAA